MVYAANEKKVRIEVGYGLEGTLTDALSRVVIANAITPRFKAGDFPGGITRGVDDVITILTTDSNDEGIVRAIIEMAHSLKLDAVAEGVETQETLDHLIRLQCDFGQGYHWSPALPAEEFFALAMRRRAAEAAAAAASASGHLTLVR